MDKTSAAGPRMIVVLVAGAALLGLIIGGISDRIQSRPLTDYESDYNRAYEEFERSEKKLSDLERISQARETLESLRSQDTKRDSAYRARDRLWTILSVFSIIICGALGVFAAWISAGFLPTAAAAVVYYFSGSAFFIGGPNVGIATGTIPLVNGAVMLLAIFFLSVFIKRRLSRESQ